MVSSGGWLPTFRRACGPVAPQFSAVPGPGQSLGLEWRTDPAVWLLSRPNFDLAFATFAANTTYWVLLKQPYKQKSRRACGRAFARRAEAVPGGSANLTPEPKPVPGSHREADTAVGPANSPCAAGAGRGSGGGGRHAPPATDESPVPVSVTGVLAAYHRQHLRVWFPQSRLLSRQELATDNFRMRRKPSGTGRSVCTVSFLALIKPRSGDLPQVYSERV